MNLAENLRKIRKENNLSQEQLAEKLGVSRQSVSKWESGQSYPEMDKVIQISKMFDLNIDELMNQDVSAVNERKQSKININKYVQSFLDYITKTINLFGSMKFKDKIKCILEQIVIAGILALLFVVVGALCKSILLSVIKLLPETAYYFIKDFIFSIYVAACVVAGFAILAQIFKIRYLNYFVIIEDESIENKEENPESKSDDIEENTDKKGKKKLFQKEQERVVIRDPDHSGYKFINGLVKCFLFIVKIFAFIIGIMFCASLIFLAAVLVCSFVFWKTGWMFVGVLLGTLALIAINAVILISLYGFLRNRKLRKGILAIIFLCSVVSIGAGVGFCAIGVQSFDYIDEINSECYETYEYRTDMSENMSIEDFYNGIEFVETDSDSVLIKVRHLKSDEVSLKSHDNGLCFIQHSNNEFELIKIIINDIKHKKLFNYNCGETIIYTSSENIKLLKENIEKLKEATVNEDIY